MTEKYMGVQQVPPSAEKKIVNDKPTIDLVTIGRKGNNLTPPKPCPPNTGFCGPKILCRPQTEGCFPAVPCRPFVPSCSPEFQKK